MRFQYLILIFCCLFTASFSIHAQTLPVTEKQISSSSKTPPQLKSPGENRYKLVSGDVVEIIYRYTPEFNQTVTIHPDGFVGLEIIGDLKLGGLTLEEARQKIIAKASVRLKDPEVTLLLKEFQKPYFVVSGEVGQGGKFEMRENITALQAVMMAGGFKDSAKSSQIVVFRKLNDEFAEVKTLNLKKIKTTSDLENDLTLESGDIIFVPRNNFSKIERYVRLTSLVSLINPLAAPFK
jgi:polysaccharide biosynthesis/export protein